MNPIRLDIVDLNFPCSRINKGCVARVDITSLIKPHPQVECDAGTWNSSLLRSGFSNDRPVSSSRFSPFISNQFCSRSSAQKHLCDVQTAVLTVEKAHIKDVLLHTPSIEEAARVMSIDPATLWRKRKKYQLD